MRYLGGIILVSFFLISGGFLSEEKNVLQSFFETFDLDSQNLIGWDFGSDDCLNYNFITCNVEGRITEIDLHGLGIRGSIPSSFSLSQLIYLDLSSNFFKGEVPLSISNGIERIFLRDNQLNCNIFYSGLVDDDFNVHNSACAVACPSSICPSGVVCSLLDPLIPTSNCEKPCTISVIPSSGVPGNILQVNGVNFYNGTIFCQFDTSTVLGKFLSFSTIECQAPSGFSTGESVNVSITIDLTEFNSSCSTPFTYNSASAVLDPHFNGFHGEKMEIKRDDDAANQIFHIYCSPLVSISSLFYEYPDKLLFMTKFWVRLGETKFTLELSTEPKLETSDSLAYFRRDIGRFRMDIHDGHLEWDEKMLRVRYKYLQINFSNRVYLTGTPYMNVDIRITETDLEPQVTGIIGRTLHTPLTEEQFENYLQFKAKSEEVSNFECSLPLNLI